MKCPYCGEYMTTGVITGNGGSRLTWTSDSNSSSGLGKMFSDGTIDADYSVGFFRPVFHLRANYCDKCEKIIINTKISQ